MAIYVLDLKCSRRGLFHHAAAAAGAGALIGVGLAAGPALAANKLSLKAAGYQDTPKGKLECDNCVQWQAPSSCKIVDGVIAPTGWCKVYVAKP